jgi:hypothetical protein
LTTHKANVLFTERLLMKASIYKIRQQKANFAACNNDLFDVKGTVSVIFKAAQNSLAFTLEATHKHRSVISA